MKTRFLLSGVGVLALVLGTAVAASDKPAAIPEDKRFQETLTGSFASPLPAGEPLRVLSWNIDRGYKLQRITSFLRDRGAGICLLQEVDFHARRTDGRDVAGELAKSLGYDYAFGIEFQELSQESESSPAYHGQATLSRWPIVKSRVIRFQKQSSWWKPHSIIPNIPFFQRRLGGRIALVTDVKVNGKLVVVYNLHLESRSGGAIQGLQMEEVLTDTRSYPAGTPILIGGDLNSKYNPTAVRHHLEQYGFHSVLGERLVRTHTIIGYLDWIFYRGAWNVRSADVIRGSRASDHDPVFSELRWETNNGLAAR